MTSQDSRVPERERGAAWFALVGLVIAVPVTFVGGFVWGLYVNGPTAVFAAFEMLVLLGWIGPVAGFAVGLVVELARPARQRRLVEREVTRR